MLKEKKAIIFDLDGTLADSMWVWSQIDIDYLGKLGYDVPEDMQRVIEGMGFTEVAVYFKERFHIPDSIDKIKKTWQEMAIDKYCNEVPLKPGVREFLPYAKERGIRMAVASSNDRKLIEAVLVSHGIREYFDCIITACEVNKGKPAPDVYLEAAGRLMVEPEYCLIFEDIVPGLQAGKAAGMTACAVEDNYSIPQRAEKRKIADYYIHSYEQVMAGTYEEL
ncbi:MAG: HAD family phosphatase [Eubacteriales bacterium]|nr:HAD family phosphatase [Eubacteriales bacterium]